ncbi:hypothetical protein ACFQ4C_03010 [Larkinella insperata]|uniref:Uncharacterized protein n=1 Tax=Larkinella insperata TaxID=332158 RepID=A0ABW3Q6A7_9BACT|nr:hypothetical protein [Larkinella insperata]
MTLTRLLELITPFTIVTGMGVVMVGYGLANLERENIVLNLFFGIPLTLVAAGAHFLVRQVLNRNTLYIWLLEAVLVVLFGGAFYLM